MRDQRRTKAELREELSDAREHIEGLERTLRYFAPCLPRIPGDAAMAVSEVLGGVGWAGDYRECARRIESMGILAAGMSHELADLLAIVLGNMELARMRTGGSALRHIDNALTAVARGRDIAGGLMRFYPDELAEGRAIDAGTVLRETIRLMRKYASAALDMEVDVHAAEGLWPVRLSTGRMQEIVISLYRNAIESLALRAHEGGPWSPIISFELDNVVIPSEFRQRGKGTGEFVRLVINDNGSSTDEKTCALILGVAPADKEPKYSTLGLLAVHDIVRKAGGFMEMDCAPGVGTAVRIFFPRPEISAEPARAIEDGKLPGGDETILLVESDPLVAETYREMIEHLGYTVFCTPGREAALRVLSERAAYMDLVLMDLALPGVRGPELVRLFRSIRPGMPIVVTGVSSDISIKGKHSLEGADVGFLPKPFGLDLLAVSLRNALGPNGRECILKRQLHRLRLSFVPERSIPHDETVTDSVMVYELFKHLADEARERFVVLLLDSQKKIIGYDDLTTGTSDQAVIYPREVLKAALLSNASFIILIHNHPSGETAPSSHDLEITRAVIRSCEAFDIGFLDHVIVGKNGFFAFTS